MEPAGGVFTVIVSGRYPSLSMRYSRRLFSPFTRVSPIFLFTSVSRTNTPAFPGEAEVAPPREMLSNQPLIWASSVVAAFSQSFMAGSLFSLTGNTGHPLLAKARAPSSLGSFFFSGFHRYFPFAVILCFSSSFARSSADCRRGVPSGQ